MTTSTENSQDAEHARLWRALLATARIRPIGSAGLKKPAEDNSAHLGLELWTKFSRNYRPELLEKLDEENALGREWLTKFAELAALCQAETR